MGKYKDDFNKQMEYIDHSLQDMVKPEPFKAMKFASRDTDKESPKPDI